MGRIIQKFWRAYFWLHEKLKKLPGLRLIPMGAIRYSLVGLIGKITTLREKKYLNPKKTVLDYDWDYLIVIDACRHDLYEKTNGKSNSIISRGSHTIEWFNNTFKKGYYDLIYTSSNPFIGKPKWDSLLSKPLELFSTNLQKGEVSFFHLEPVWEYGWDEELKTVPPARTTRAALRITKQHPNKKMIIHYIQPHSPFIGEERIKVSKGIESALNITKGKLGIQQESIWDLFSVGEVNRKQIWKAYESNLELVMREVRKLTKELEGKVVLTSDHGNLIGEYGICWHPKGLRVPELVKVPWVVLKEREDKKEKGELRGINI